MTSRHTLNVMFTQSISFKFSSVKDAKRFASEPVFSISFEPNDADDSNENFHIKPACDLSQLTPTELDPEHVKKTVQVSFSYIFAVDVDQGCDCDAFDEWASEYGGWATFRIEPTTECDWYFDEDFEGETRMSTRDGWGFVLDGNENWGESLEPDFG